MKENQFKYIKEDSLQRWIEKIRNSRDKTYLFYKKFKKRRY